MYFISGEGENADLLEGADAETPITISLPVVPPVHTGIPRLTEAGSALLALLLVALSYGQLKRRGARSENGVENNQSGCPMSIDAGNWASDSLP